MLGQWMEKEILEQPFVLTTNGQRYFEELHHRLSNRRFDMAVLVARGSSDNAALYARYLFEIHLGIPVSLAAPSVLTRYGTHVKYPNCLAIGISQSGAAPDVAEVLASCREAGHTTLGITNTENSRITQAAEFSLLMDTGPEKSVAATKTYSASLLALYQLVRALGANLPDPMTHLPTDYFVDAMFEQAAEESGIVVRSNPVFSLARGYGFCTAQETALKLMECALIACKSYSSADFEHGPKALAGHGSAVISFDGHKEALAAQGAHILEAPVDDAPECLRPIQEIVFGQAIALLAARARGLNPDDPRHIQKVTETL
ncbi:MAG: SIS domain-containing protein [Fimbriimonadaceae bacterium]|nr:SIS domain-containing protein [Fimbriimonadaceae bacterium]